MSVYVVVGSWSSRDGTGGGEDVDHVRVWSSRAAAEGDASRYVRAAQPSGQTKRVGDWLWIRHPSDAVADADPDGAITAHAAVYRRQIRGPRSRLPKEV